VRRAVVLGVVLLLAGVAFFAGRAITSSVSGSPGDGGAVEAAGASVASAPMTYVGGSPSASEAGLAALATLQPAARTVVPAAGPFDDRLTFASLGWGEREVRAQVGVDDVGEVLEFEAVAGFYDAGGALLGTGRFVLPDAGDDDHGGAAAAAGRVIEVRIGVPSSLRGRAVSAAIGVPILVTE
jgi:hypothetical protein